MAHQLGDRLVGFDLMSPAYTPVYHARKASADQLPDGAARQTSAAVIGRLMNNVKLGYYSTDPANIPCVTELEEGCYAIPAVPKTPHIIKGRMVKQRRTETTDPVSFCGTLIGQEIREVISNKMVFSILTVQGFRELT